MTTDELRKLQVASERPGLVCLMKDGRQATLIFWPCASDGTFGFHVPGEEDCRWRRARAIERAGGGLVEGDAPYG